MTEHTGCCGGGCHTGANDTLVMALERVLGETFSLYINTQACHWNVTGGNFQSLHTLFGNQYEALHTAIDDLAERIRALGSPAPKGGMALLKASHLPDGLGHGTDREMLKALIAAHEGLTHTLKAAIELADEQDDVGTEDMLIGRLQEHDKMVWMLKSSL